MEYTENTNIITTESIKNLSHVLSHVCQKIGFRVPKYFCNLFIYCSLQNSTKSNWKIQYFLHRKMINLAYLFDIQLIMSNLMFGDLRYSRRFTEFFGGF